MTRETSPVNQRTRIDQGMVAEHGGILRRKCDCGGTGADGCAPCRARDESTLRRKTPEASSPPSVVPDIVHDVLGSDGEPLDGDIRTSLEPRFGHDFSGDNRKTLIGLIDTEAENIGLTRGEKWTMQGVMEILNRQGDEAALGTVISQGYRIFSVEAAFDKWKNNSDGTIVEERLRGFRGNTCISVEDGCPKPKEIRIRAALSDIEGASALFHEIQHVVRGETATHEEELKEEVDVRVDTEEFRTRHGMGPFKKSYRNPDGSVNKAAIDKEVHGSGHYNPNDRERVGRRYQGEKEITGWRSPAKKSP
ncbi:MAG: hypothetical protein JWQ98_1368 [Chlorobi bacterium]|nr:hypothetical protein [Chlorobiota bacterium]